MFKRFKKDSDPQQMELTISTNTVLRVVALVILALLFLAALKIVAHSLILIFTAFFLSLALNAPVHWIARHLPGSLHGKRSVATTISFLFVVLVIGIFLASIVPPLVHQTQNFIDAAPGLVRDAHNQNSELGSLIRRYKLENQLDNLSSEISSRLNFIGSTAVSSIGKVGSSIFSVLTILVLTFMMLIEGPTVLEFARELVPKRRRADAERLALDMYRVVKGYINGQVILAAIASVLVFFGLMIFHTPYAFALVMVVFICGLIPMVGHTLGAIIVTLVTLTVSPFNAVGILLYYFLYQQIENYVIQPRIQANSTNMSPLLVFISVVVGVSFGGLFGGLFAIPIAGCIRILILDYLVNHDYIADAPVISETAKDAKA